MAGLEKIKTGIIGYGLRGKGVTKNILVNGNFRLIAIADLDERALKEAKESPLLKGIELYKDYKKVLEIEEIDAVFVITPQFTHRDIAVDAFNSGKSVYCEKPMALTVKECDEMIEASKRANKILMIGQQMRYHAHLNKMKNLIDKGEIGKPVMLWLNEFRNPFPETMKWGFDKKKSGGLLLEKDCHHFDLFNWFTDSRPVQVFVSGGQDVIHKPFGIESDILDNAWVIVDYENGVKAMLGICMFAGLPHKYEAGIGTHTREIGVIGKKGMIRTEGFDLGRNVEVRYPHNRDVVLHQIETKGNIPNPYNGEGNRGILVRFAQCIREGAKPEASGEIGKMAVAVSLAAERSAKEKRIVKISEVL